MINKSLISQVLTADDTCSLEKNVPERFLRKIQRNLPR